MYVCIYLSIYLSIYMNRCAKVKGQLDTNGHADGIQVIKLARNFLCLLLPQLLPPKIDFKLLFMCIHMCLSVCHVTARARGCPRGGISYQELQLRWVDVDRYGR